MAASIPANCNVDPRARLLLTSSGLSTDAIRESALRVAGHSASRVSPKLRILRLSDGWKPFEAQDRITPLSKVAHNAESVVAELWSNRYLRYVYGRNVKIETLTAARHESSSVGAKLLGTDLLLLPGGNTFQLGKAIVVKKNVINEAIESGEVGLLTESAGSIIAGKSIRSALIKPADTTPHGYALDHALELVNAEIVCHAPGRNEDLAVPYIHRLAELAFKSNESPPEAVNQFRGIREALGDNVIVLHDAAAVEFCGGNGLVIASQ